MKKVLGLALFLFGLVSTGLSQNPQRSTFAVQNNSGYLKVIPFAPITLCEYNSGNQCNTPVTIYSDSALTSPISYPYYADGNGYFSYFSASGNYIEQQCVPAGGCFTYFISFPSGGGSSSGTVTNFSSGNASPLFTTSVSNPSTVPNITFGLSSSVNNTVYGNFSGSTATPSFWTLAAGTGISFNPSGTTLTISSSSGSGTVTNVSQSGYPSIFGTLSISNPTTTPAFGFNPPSANQNTFLAGSCGSGSGTPTYRIICAADLPLATVSAFGAVKPDGSSIAVSSGIISVPQATSSTFGIVKPDNTTVTISGGILSAASGGCTSGCTFTTSTINGVNPTTSGSSTTFLNGQGNYTTPSGSSLIFQTNAVNNATQTGLNLAAGAGVSLINTAGNTVQINAGGAVLPSTNLIGYYTPTSTTVTGTTIPDNSGHGNNLTLCPCSSIFTAPTPTSVGLNFPITTSSPGNGANISTASVIEPSPMSAQTNAVVMSVYITPQGTGVSAGGVIGSGVNNGVQAGLVLTGDTTPFYSGVAWALIEASASDVQTYSPQMFNAATPPQFQISGYHILGIDFGTWNGSSCTSNDVLYIDGKPMTGTYVSTGCSGGRLVSGTNHFYVGPAPPWSGIGYSFPGTLYSLAQYSANLGASGQTAAAQAILAENYSRGIATTVPSSLNSQATLFCAGDSITYGQGILTPYCSLLTLNNPPTTQTLIEAVSGTTIDAMVGSEPNRIIPQCYSPLGPCITSLFEGTNNFLFNTNDTPITVFGKLSQHTALLRAAGAKVGALTMLSRTNTNAPAATACSGSFDTCKDAYNPLIVNSGVSAGITFIVDVANFPGFGADGAYANPTSPCNASHTVTPAIGGTSACFQSDGTHPTQAGAQAIADMYSNVYNHVFGYTRLNPHFLTSSSTPYQIAPGDGGLAVTGTVAQTATMPDCSGQTGLDYFIVNRSTATITLNELISAQPINGVSSISISAGTSVDLFVQANSYTTSGCQWIY